MTWYTAGSVSTTANSNRVNGNSTAWLNSGIRAGDMLLIGYNTDSPRPFEIKSIDTQTQITLVNNFPVTISNAAYAAIPMLSGDRTAITMDLATQVTKALKDNQAMQAVWQSFYSSTGIVTLTMPDGTSVTGSSFKKLTDDMALKANTKDLGDAAFKNTGTNTGSVAAGDDLRLGTINNKSGGSVTGNILASGFIRLKNSAGAGGSEPGTFIGYNLTSGASDIINQRSLGAGGIRFSVQSNTGSELAAFSMSSDGSAYSGKGKWVDASGSDVRLKDEIKAIENPLDKLSKLNGCTWVYKDSDSLGKKGIGVVAQELQELYPWSVIQIPFPKPMPDGTEITDALAVQSGDAGVTTAVLIESVKQLMSILRSGINAISESTGDEMLREKLNALASKIPG